MHKKINFLQRISRINQFRTLRNITSLILVLTFVTFNRIIDHRAFFTFGNQMSLDSVSPITKFSTSMSFKENKVINPKKYFVRRTICKNLSAKCHLTNNKSPWSTHLNSFINPCIYDTVIFKWRTTVNKLWAIHSMWCLLPLIDCCGTKRYNPSSRSGFSTVFCINASLQNAIILKYDCGILILIVWNAVAVLCG